MGRGGLAPDRDVRARLKALPALEGVQVEVEDLEGHFHDTLLRAVGHRLFRPGATPEEIEAARQQLLEEMRRESEDVKLHIDIRTGMHHVRAIRQREPAPEDP